MCGTSVYIENVRKRKETPVSVYRSSSNKMATDKKYSLTDETIEVLGHTLFRIKAERDIAAWDVKAGDLGGFVESEENRSHDGDAWVSDNAKIYENGKVLDNALVSDSTEVSQEARVCEDARVSGDAKVFDIIRVTGVVSGDTAVYYD